MPIKLTAKLFLEVVKKSGLIEPDRLTGLLLEYRTRGIDLGDPCAISGALVSSGAITPWQAEKLQRGKHKGFFLGNYRLISLLGKGGMSSVYLAEHLLMRRYCAIKVLPAHRIHDTSYLARFHREAQAVASLDHPNIVRAYDVGKEIDRDHEIHYLVMEYVEGEELQDRVLKRGPLSYVEAAECIRQASEGLQHAHQASMVHRDIKPGNLLVDTNGVVKILDLGLARLFKDGDENALTIQHDEKVLGTADYLAPEQALDSHRVDIRADIYSLGCTMYFLLIGHPPFMQRSLAQRLLAHQTKQPSPIALDRPDVPQVLAKMVEKMMAKRPADRYQSAADVGRELRIWLVENGQNERMHRHPGRVVAASLRGSNSSHGPEPEMQGCSRGELGSEAEVRFAASGSISMPVGQAKSRRTPVAATSTTSNPKAPAASGQSSKRPPFANRTVEISASETDELPPSVRTPQKSLLNDGTPPPIFESVPSAQAASSPDGSSRNIQPVNPTALVSMTLSDRPITPLPHRRERSRSSLSLAALCNKISINRFVLATVVILAASTVLIGGMYLFRRTDRRSDLPVVSPSGAPAVDENTSPRLITDFRVGQNGNFPTINAALAYIRQHSVELQPVRRHQEIVVKVVGGQTFRDRIHLDNSDNSYPKGIRLVVEGSQPAVLEPDGDGPIIWLSQLERFSIEGFELRANGNPVAIRLDGFLAQTNLRNLKITGFTKTGLVAHGTNGLHPKLRLSGLKFQAENREAVGIELRRGESDVAHIAIQKCRFLAPLATGLLANSDLTAVEIRENIFAGIETGVMIAGADRQLANLLVGNNTFYDLDTGIAFAHMPHADSRDLGFYRNLFDQVEAEVVVQSGYDMRKFFRVLTTDRAGWEYNWTTRPIPEHAAPGDIDMFTSGGRRDAHVEYVSTDPSSPKFLAPTDRSSHGSFGQVYKGLKRHIGAIAP